VFSFDRPVLQVAQELLGATIRFGEVAVRITETETYAGPDDPAAHAVGGPRPRTKDLFGPPGTLYCYLSHGIHVCGNLVCEAEGQGAAVLLRAGAVTDGIALARQRRWGLNQPTRPDSRLASGPGCLGQALGLTLAHSGLMVDSGFTLTARESAPLISSGPRVGVSKAWQRPWRFWIPADPSVSAYRRSPRALTASW
jgi:DNA-3-methyladenine glycosylase